MGGHFQIDVDGGDKITVEPVQGKVKILTIERPARTTAPAEKIAVRLPPADADDLIYALNWGRSVKGKS